jgi:peptidoglycan/xylan/chitin deacetylase (PgdA/CDA1 family)
MSTLSKHCKEAVKFACAAGYSVLQPLTQHKPHRVILYYHSVKSQYRRQFEKQMAYLAEYCRVVKVSEIKTAAANGSDTVAAITFDDAFESVFKNAVPILKAFKLPAAIFVPTSNLGRLPRWSLSDMHEEGHESVMSVEQIAELARDGFEIFSHTVSHPRLTLADEKTLHSELTQSKKDLEAIIGKDVTAVSFPHGDHNLHVCAAARKAGYSYGFTIEPHLVNGSSDDMRIGRFAVSPADGLVKFRLKVNGAYVVSNWLRPLLKIK